MNIVDQRGIMSSTSMPEGNKLWGGRFSTATDPLMEAFNQSIKYDKRLWAEDIEGSLAYIKALEKVSIVTNEEQVAITNGLQKVYKEWENNEFVLQPSDEDIHTANERRLKELVGKVGGKLHTGRSRNDQVVTDVRLWLKKRIKEIRSYLIEFLIMISERAGAEINFLMPGYTHMQRAQPIRWSHWLMSYAWALKRDLESLDHVFERVDILPLGSGALAGNPFGVDREFLAKDLKFARVSENSLDGTGGRDFIAEFLFWVTMVMIHFSKLSEDLILYNSKEFGFVTISDAYSTGSSLMPQKKNPDSLELMRGKSGRAFGNFAGVWPSYADYVPMCTKCKCTSTKFSGFLMTMKGLPSTYNKDLQEDKENLFDSVDTIKAVIQIATGTLATLTVNKEKCLAALSPDMLATDVAYYLVRKGVPFRDAHSLSGSVVHLAETKGVPLTQLSVEDMKTVHPAFGDDVQSIWNYESSIEQYSSTGGTSKAAVLEQVQKMSEWLKTLKRD